jgi:hypothetical protein
MPDQITVTRGAADRVVLTAYPAGDQPVRLELSPKRAALIGLDLLMLALEPVFRLGAGK